MLLRMMAERRREVGLLRRPMKRSNLEIKIEFHVHNNNNNNTFYPRLKGEAPPSWLPPTLSLSSGTCSFVSPNSSTKASRTSLAWAFDSPSCKRNGEEACGERSEAEQEAM